MESERYGEQYLLFSGRQRTVKHIETARGWTENLSAKMFQEAAEGAGIRCSTCVDLRNSGKSIRWIALFIQQLRRNVKRLAPVCAAYDAGEVGRAATGCTLSGRINLGILAEYSVTVTWVVF